MNLKHPYVPTAQGAKNENPPSALKPGSPQPPSAVGRGKEAADIDLLYYVHLLFQHRWVILFFILIFLVLGAMNLRKATPSYSSTATITYEPPKTKILPQQDMFVSTRSTFYYRVDEMQTAVEMIRSPKTAQAVIDALGLYAKSPAPSKPQPESMITKARQVIPRLMDYARLHLVNFPPVKADRKILDLQDNIRNLLGKIEVKQRKNTKLVEITCTDTEPVRATRIANEFANQFILGILEEQTQAFGYARSFLREQIEKSKKSLEEEEKKLYQFSGQSDLKAMEETSKIAVDTMVTLTRDIEQARNEIVSLEGQKEAVDIGSIQKVLVMEDPYYDSLTKKLSDLRLQRITLASENKAEMPTVRKLDLEISGVEDQLTSAAVSVRQTVGSRLKMAQIRLQHLITRLEEQKQKVHEIEGQMITYRMYQRQVDSTRGIFEGLMDQFKRLDVVNDLSTRGVSVVNLGDIPTQPTSPKVGSTLFRHGFMGGILGITMVLLFSWLDRSVKNPSLIEERFKLATLGYVPFLVFQKRLKSLLRKGGGFTMPLILHRGESEEVGTEAFRYLRTSLQYSSADHPPQVILMTSCVPKEGKSTISANLGICFAETGQPTLLIDADLRRPVLHQLFGHPKMPGLSDVLTGQKTLDEVIIHLDTPNLDLIAAGPSTPSPLSLLESQTMSDLLAILRKRYTTVILDSAPSHVLADSLVLSTKVDGVCVVVKRGSTLMEVLESTVQKLQSLGANILGVVYNHTQSRSASAYGYRYRDNYKYNYYYSSKSPESAKKK